MRVCPLRMLVDVCGTSYIAPREIRERVRETEEKSKIERLRQRLLEKN